MLGELALERIESLELLALIAVLLSILMLASISLICLQLVSSTSSRDDPTINHRPLLIFLVTLNATALVSLVLSVVFPLFPLLLPLMTDSCMIINILILDLNYCNKHSLFFFLFKLTTYSQLIMVSFTHRCSFKRRNRCYPCEALTTASSTTPEWLPPMVHYRAMCE